MIKILVKHWAPAYYTITVTHPMLHCSSVTNLRLRLLLSVHACMIRHHLKTVPQTPAWDSFYNWKPFLKSWLCSCNVHTAEFMAWLISSNRIKCLASYNQHIPPSIPCPKAGRKVPVFNILTLGNCKCLSIVDIKYLSNYFYLLAIYICQYHATLQTRMKYKITYNYYHQGSDF